MEPTRRRARRAPADRLRRARRARGPDLPVPAAVRGLRALDDARGTAVLARGAGGVLPCAGARTDRAGRPVASRHRSRAVHGRGAGDAVPAQPGPACVAVPPALRARHRLGHGHRRVLQRATLRQAQARPPDQPGQELGRRLGRGGRDVRPDGRGADRRGLGAGRRAPHRLRHRARRGGLGGGGPVREPRQARGRAQGFELAPARARRRARSHRRARCSRRCRCSRSSGPGPRERGESGYRPGGHAARIDRIDRQEHARRARPPLRSLPRARAVGEHERRGARRAVPRSPARARRRARRRRGRSAGDAAEGGRLHGDPRRLGRAGARRHRGRGGRRHGRRRDRRRRGAPADARRGTGPASGCCSPTRRRSS